MSGRIDAICVSARKGERKAPVASAQLVANHGIEGDAHAGPWHRQVSLLAAEDVESMRRKGLPDLKAGDFAENLVEVVATVPREAFQAVVLTISDRCSRGLATDTAGVSPP